MCTHAPAMAPTIYLYRNSRTNFSKKLFNRLEFVSPTEYLPKFTFTWLGVNSNISHMLEKAF